MKEIIANIFGVDQSNVSYVTIGFAHDSSYQDYINLQFSYKISEQDIRLGMTKYYLELGPDGVGGYGCIDSIILYRTKLLLQLNVIGSRIFKIEQIEIKFGVDVITSFDVIKENLFKMFGDDKSLLFEVRE